MADPLAEFKRASARFQRDVARAMAQATRAASAVLVEEMQGLAGAVDHTLQELAALGHPYSTRPEAGPGPHPDFIVHEQEGDLLGSIGRVKPTVTPEGVTGGVTVTDPKAEWLLLGTPTMRPRDFVSAAIIYQEDAVAEIFRKAHAGVHDEPAVQQGFRMDVNLGDHGEHPAELPVKE